MSILDWILLEMMLGLSAGCLGFAAGIGFKNIAIPRIKVAIFDLANSYVAGFIENLQKNPELAENLARPFITAALKELQVPQGSQGGKTRGLKIFGFPVPQELGEMPLKKLAGNFLGDQTGTKNQISSPVLQLPEG